MKKLLTFLMCCTLAVSLFGEIASYIFTKTTTPCNGVLGEVVGVQACSTNATGVATLSSITTLSIGNTLVPFTNELITLTLDNGVSNVSTNGIFIAPKQTLIVSGSAFGGGAITIWVEK